jgi:hypothetical protein
MSQDHTKDNTELKDSVAKIFNHVKNLLEKRRGRESQFKIRKAGVLELEPTKVADPVSDWVPKSTPTKQWGVHEKVCSSL